MNHLPIGLFTGISLERVLRRWLNSGVSQFGQRILGIPTTETIKQQLTKISVWKCERCWFQFRCGLELRFTPIWLTIYHSQEAPFTNVHDKPVGSSIAFDVKLICMRADSVQETQGDKNIGEAYSRLPPISHRYYGTKSPLGVVQSRISNFLKNLVLRAVLFYSFLLTSPQCQRANRTKGLR